MTTFGHAAGDTILTQISERLREHFRTEDTIGGLGADTGVAHLASAY